MVRECSECGAAVGERAPDVCPECGRAGAVFVAIDEELAGEPGVWSLQQLWMQQGLAQYDGRA
jgi:hypothetical protein